MKNDVVRMNDKPDGSIKRLNVNLPTPVFEEILELAQDSNQTLSAFVRRSFALSKIAHDELEKGNRLAIVDRDGRVLKELVLVS